nr:Ig-like domain-containing protein [Prochloraceae cyanobacterium]
MLYGCRVAAGDAGAEFIAKLHSLTGAEITASANYTGCAALGGDWNLEVQTKPIETSLAFQKETIATYKAIMPISVTPTNNTTTLRSNLLGTDPSKFAGMSNIIVSTSGNAAAFGTFTNDPFSLGGGVVISTGNVTNVQPNAGANNDQGAVLDTDFGSSGTAGDSITLTITFDLDASAPGVFLTYVFGSEEFPEFAQAGFNDNFSIRVNGTNLALLNDGRAVTIDNLVAVRNDPSSGSPDYINNNTTNPSNNSLGGVGTLNNDTQLDGYTRPLFVVALSSTPSLLNVGGSNTIIITIQDVGDGQYDSAALFKAGSLGTTPPVTTIVGVNALNTNNPSPQITGSVDNPFATINVTVNGTTYSATNNQDGTWTLPAGTITPPLPDATYDVSVTATDTFGLTATDNTNNELVIDTTPPTSVPTVNSQNINDTTPTITGTATPAAGETLTVAVNGVTYTEGDGNLTLTGSSWSLTIPPANTLTENTYNVTATLTDAAGNTTSDATTGEIIVDLTPPVTPTVTSQSTNDTTPTITGTATVAAGETLRVTVNGVTYTEGDGNLTLTGTSWDLNIPAANALVENTYSVTAAVTDAAGNVATDITNSELIVDLTPPAPAPTVTNQTTNNTTPTITGTATVAAGDTLTVTVNGVTYTEGDGNLTRTGNNWSLAIPAINSLSDGTYNVTATVTDAAGNATNDTSAGEIIVDATPPGVPAVNSQITNNTTPTITGTATILPGETFTVNVNGITYTAGDGNLSVTGGNWSLTIPPTDALSDNTYNVTATVTDIGGNATSDVTSGELIVDTTPPAVAPTVVSQTTNNSAPTITGTATVVTGDILTVTVNGITYTEGDGNLTLTGNNWSLNIPGTNALTDNTYDVTATVTDPAGNTASDSTSGELIIDTTTPVTPTVTSQTTNDTTPTITGTATVAAGETLSVTVNGVTYNLGDGNLTLTGNNWSLAIPGTNALTDNTYDVTATVTDAAGNAISDTSTGELIIDTTAPAVAPTVISQTTNNTTPTITGTATVAAGDTLTVTVNGVTYTAGDGNLDLTGNNWTLNIPAANALTDNTYDVTATVTDVAGNATSDSTSGELIIDTVAPAAPTVVSQTTNNTTPTITGTAVVVAGETLSVEVDRVVYTVGDGNLSLTGGNSWTLTIPAANALVEDIYNVTATVTDAGGNATSDSTTNELNIITTPPGTPTVNTQSTNNSTPTLTGTATVNPGDTFTVTVNGVTYTAGDGNLSVTGNTWSLTIPATNALPDATYDVTATDTDGAGNVSSDLTSGELIIDTVAPAAPTVVSQTTSNTTPTITGTATVGVGEVLSVTVNGVTYVKGDGNLTLTGNNWSLTIPATNALADNTYNVTATVTDVGGNATSDSTNGELIIDTTAPIVPTINSLDTNDTTPTLTGTATVAPGETLSVTVNGITYTVGDGNLSLTGNNWSLTIPATNALADNTYDITATVTDAAGNGISDTTTGELIVDTTPPAAPTINILNTNSGTPTITGTATLVPGDILTVTVNGVTYTAGDGNLTVEGDGTWSLKIPPANALPADNYDVVVTVTDEAGNATSETSNGELTIETTPPTLVSSIPADNAADVAVNDNIVLTFSENIQPGTGNIVIKNANGTVAETFDVATSTQLTFNGDTVTIDPTNNLNFSTDYYIEITNGAITDTVGNNYEGIADATTLNFTTTNAPDNSPPNLITTTPADNATDVAINSNIVLTFDEPVVAGTGNITIFNQATGALVATIPIDDPNQVNLSGDTITLDPINNLAPGTSYYVNIAPGAVTDLANNPYAGINNPTTFNFSTIAAPDTVAPTLVTSTPADNAIDVAINDNIVLTFSEPVHEATGNITIIDATTNTPVATISVADSNQVNFSGDTVTIDPDVNLVTGTDYYITIDPGAIEDFGNNDYAGINNPTTLNFTTVAAPDKVAPTLVTTTPADNATEVPVNSNLVLTFDEPVHEGIGNITIFEAATNTPIATISAADPNQVNFTGDTVTIDPGVSLQPGTDYYVTIDPGAIEDFGNNDYAGINNPTTFNFSTIAAPDVVPPTLVSTTPADNATEVPVNSNIVLTFDEPVHEGIGNITIFEAATNTPVATVSVADPNQVNFSGDTVTIDPSVNLQPGTDYYVTIDPGAIEDFGNNDYAGINNPTTFNFSTVAVPDVVPPTLVSTTPADNATEVPVNSNLVLTFSEPVHEGVGNITIFDAATNTPIATISAADPNQINYSGDTVTIDPSVNLQPGTDYYVTIDPGAIEDFGNNDYAGINNPTTFNFTTIATPDTTPPTLVSTTPADNATEVALNDNIVLTFSEPVTEGTGNITIFDAVTNTPVATISVADPNQVNFTGDTVTIDPDINLEPGTDYYVNIDPGAIEDLANNDYAGINNPTTFNFTTVIPPDTIAPTLINSNPADNATDVPVNSNIVLTFSEPVTEGTGNITIFDAATNTPVATINVADPNQVNFTGDKVNIDPNVNLQPGTDYYITIDPGAIEDLANNDYAGINNPTTLNFTTGATPDTVAPTLVSTTPADNATEVPINGNIVLTFSEPVNEGTGNITIFDATTNTPVATISVADPNQVNFNGDTVTIDPNVNLQPGRDYYVTIDPGAIEDLANNDYAGIVDRTTFNFSTGADRVFSTLNQFPINFNVLDENFSPNINPVEITQVTQGENGTVLIEDNGTPNNPSDDFVVYTPNPGFVGEDRFTYTVTDSQGNTFTETISVKVKALGLDDSSGTAPGVPVEIDVLANDKRDLTISAVTNGQNGTVTIDNNGTPNDSSDDFIVYTPNPGFVGEDSFTYTVTDAEGNTESA